MQLDCHWASGSGDVEFGIYDILGRRVRTLAVVDGGQDQRVMWDGLNDGGDRVAVGVYFLQLQDRTATRTRRITVVR